MKNLTKILLKHHHIRLIVAMLALNVALFVSVDPRTASAYWLFIGFGLVAATIFTITYALLQLPTLKQTSIHRLGYYGAALIVVLIGMQSIGQLTPRDIVTLLPFAAGVYWYATYNKKRTVEPASS